MEVTPQIDARKARSEKTKARLEGKGYTVYTEHLIPVSYTHLTLPTIYSV